MSASAKSDALSAVGQGTQPPTEVALEVDGSLMSALASVANVAGICGRIIELTVYFAPPLACLPGILLAQYIIPNVGAKVLCSLWHLHACDAVADAAAEQAVLPQVSSS